MCLFRRIKINIHNIKTNLTIIMNNMYVHNYTIISGASMNLLLDSMLTISCDKLHFEVFLSFITSAFSLHVFNLQHKYFVNVKNT